MNGLKDNATVYESMEEGLAYQANRPASSTTNRQLPVMKPWMLPEARNQFTQAMDQSCGGSNRFAVPTSWPPFLSSESSNMAAASSNLAGPSRNLDGIVINDYHKCKLCASVLSSMLCFIFHCCTNSPFLYYFVVHTCTEGVGSVHNMIFNISIIAALELN